LVEKGLFFLNGPVADHFREFGDAILEKFVLVFARIGDYFPEKVANFRLEVPILVIFAKVA